MMCSLCKSRTQCQKLTSYFNLKRGRKQNNPQFLFPEDGIRSIHVKEDHEIISLALTGFYLDKKCFFSPLYVAFYEFGVIHILLRHIKKDTGWTFS